MTGPKVAEKDTVRDQIVDAAKKRFSHFGYAKTTMAEVAGDCAKSPGNLYRFFPGKLDIAEAIATEDYSKHLEHLRKLAVQPGKTGQERAILMFRIDRIDDVFLPRPERHFAAGLGSHHPQRGSPSAGPDHPDSLINY